MKHVFLLDDDHDFRTSLRCTLEKESYRVTDFSDGKTALTQLQRRQPDLLITDMVMPQTPGYEVIVAVRRDFPNLKILAISGGARLAPQEYLNLASLVGANQTIRKPFQSKDLIAAVRSLIGND
jgi:CheY-like chemotaxis protein